MLLKEAALVDYLDNSLEEVTRGNLLEVAQDNPLEAVAQDNVLEVDPCLLHKQYLLTLHHNMLEISHLILQPPLAFNFQEQLGPAFIKFPLKLYMLTI